MPQDNLRPFVLCDMPASNGRTLLCPRGSLTDYLVQPERIHSHIPVPRASPSLPFPHGVGNPRPLRSQLIVYWRFHRPVLKLSTPRMVGSSWSIPLTGLVWMLSYRSLCANQGVMDKPILRFSFLPDKMGIGSETTYMYLSTNAVLDNFGIETQSVRHQVTIAKYNVYSFLHRIRIQNLNLVSCRFNIIFSLNDSKMSRSQKMPLRSLHLFWKKVPKYPAILCLDERILQKIYQHLSLVNQVCLSLSCKELYGLFGTIVKHKDLEFPRLLRIRNPIVCVNSQDVLRNQLLLRLENRRWAYCARCLKLHPRKEFTRHLLRQSALERSCTYYAGIADLCPCISLTIRGRDQLVKILKQSAKPAKTRYGPFVYEVDDRGQPSLGHVCEFSTRSGYVMRVALVLVIIKETGQLCAAARHTITFSFPDAHFTAEPTFACPHQDLLSLVPENQAAEDPHMHQTLISSKPHQDILSFVPGKLVSKACVACPTLITKYALSEDKNLAAFWVVRNLGSCKWPVDRPWFDQCRLTGTLFSHNDIYW